MDQPSMNFLLNVGKSIWPITRCQTYKRKYGRVVMLNVKPLEERDYELIKAAEEVIEKITDMNGIISAQQ